MKKIVQSLVLCLFLVSIFNTANGQTLTLVHYWDFNDTSTGINYMPNIPAIHASFSLIDTAKAKFWYQALSGTTGNTTSYLDFLTPGDATNARNGSAAGSCIRMRNPYDSMQGVFYIPSTGYHNIVISFATEKSGSGPTTQTYSISLDSGATWITTGMSATTTTISATASPFQLVTVSLSPNADNNPKLVFRIQQSGATAGNNRYDNFAVESSSVVYNSVEQISNSQIEGTLYPNPTTGNIVINIPAQGEKAVAIYNITGQKVISTTSSENLIHINTSALANSLYFVNVQVGSQHTSMKFIKN